MADKEPKSAYELAMEKLRQRDRERGETAPASLTEGQKKQIAEIRQIYEARLAEREILFRSEKAGALARAADDPEAAGKVEEAYGRDRRRLEEEREAKIAKVRSGRKGAKGGS